MSLSSHLLIIVVLIFASAFFSIAEISLAVARKIKLRQLEEEGVSNASKVLALQENPGKFFTVVQIGLNGVAILAGILGEEALTPYFKAWVGYWYTGPWLDSLCFALSFLFVTSLFVLFADVTPKRLAMLAPERIAVAVVRPMLFMNVLFSPVVWVFDGILNAIFHFFNLPSTRNEDITSDDIVAMVAAGAEAGVVQRQEHHLIENVFELDSRSVPSSMTTREDIVYFTFQESEPSIREKIAASPHSKFLVCDVSLDHLVGYVDSKDILKRLLKSEAIRLSKEIVRPVMMIPDSLTLSELLERFKAAREDFAVVMNEYAFVVGIITLDDVMNTVMGDLVYTFQEEQIIQRDERSWLVDGLTPLDDVGRVLGIDAFPDDAAYETMAGFMMYMLRKIPKLTDTVEFGGYKFEVVDTENYKVDQLLITRIEYPENAEPRGFSRD